MNKIFDIIDLPDYSVVVGGKGQVGDICYNSLNDKTFKIYFSEQVFDDALKIIATIGKRIEDIPLIEMPDELDKELFDKCRQYVHKRYPNLKGAASATVIEERYNGYKAAQRGTFSGEDMAREIRSAYIHGQGNAQAMEAGLERDETEDYVNYRMIALTSKKKKLPVQVELEMEERDIREWTGDLHSTYWTVKITNPLQNTITPVNIKV